MSLDTTLARISQLDALLYPSSAATSTARAASTVASGAETGTSPGTGATFMTTLRSAMAPDVAGGTGSTDPMVRIAESQVGQAEQPPGSNDSPAIATYRSAVSGARAGEPWCAYFVSWAAEQAGRPIGPGGAGLGYVGDIWSWAQQSGRAVPNGPGVTPAPGDLIVFGDHHVGIVEQALPNGSVQTIEGNYSNQVSRVIRGAREATGYVRMS
jgi:hypothetical protein